MSQLTIHVLGAPTVRLDNTPVALNERKVLALLIYLAVTARPQRRDTLATLFWPEQSQRQARAYLRQTLWTLRKAVGEDWLVTTGDTIELALSENFQLDLADFNKLIDGSHTAQSSVGLSALETAAALYQDDFLAGFTLEDCPAFDDWQFFEAESARLALIAALDRLVAHYSATGAMDQAIGHARRRLAMDTLHEPAHRTLMHLYARSGRQSAALYQADECVRLLDEELSVEPEEKTLALVAAIRAREIGPAVAELGQQAGATALQSSLISALVEERAVVLPRPERPLFVGREAQVAQLEDALAQALTGRGQLRIITGEAGAGKSALITEFSHRLRVDHEEVVVTLGACDAQSGQVDPYLPFREILGDLTGSGEVTLDGSATVGLTPDQLHRLWSTTCRALLEHGPDLMERFVPGPVQKRVLDLALAAGWQEAFLPDQQPKIPSQPVGQSQMVEQYIAVLKAISTRFPLVLVLEDLHWVDDASISLLSRLVRQLTGAPILVIGAYRSEAVSPADARATDPTGPHPLMQMVLEAQRNLGTIYIDLEAARAAEGQHWVELLLDAEPNRLDGAFRSALHHQTQGHPLFVVELMEELKKSGALVQDSKGAWIVGTGLDWQTLPARVEGAIAGRMIHLTAEQRWWLTISSVVGEHFLAEVVAQVAGVDPREVVRVLSDELQHRHRLVEAEGIERLGGQRLTRYRFCHNLMQVYLYDRLDEVQRSYLHEDVAHALEALYGEASATIAVQLAHHCQSAGLAERAIDYLTLAADEAQRLFAFADARQHLTQALDLLVSLPEDRARDQREFALQSMLGVVIEKIRTGIPEGKAALTRALVLGRQLGETEKLIPILFSLSMVAQVRLQAAEARAYGEESLRLAEGSQNPELLMGVYRTLSSNAHGLGEHVEAVEYGNRMIAFYRAQLPNLPFDDLYILAHILTRLGLSLTPLGYPDRALQQAQEGLALVQERAHQFGVVHCEGIMAMIHLLRGDYQPALHCCEVAMDLLETYEFPQLRSMVGLQHCIALTGVGQTTAGLALMRQVIAEREAKNSPWGNYTTQALMAEACGRVGQIAEGLAQVAHALDYLALTDDRQIEPKMQQIKGDLLLLQDLAGADLAKVQQEAEGHFRQAIALAQRRQTKLWEARALASLCRLHRAQGRDEGCLQQLADLYGWFTEGFETEDLRVVQTVLQEPA